MPGDTGRWLSANAACVILERNGIYAAGFAFNAVLTCTTPLKTHDVVVRSCKLGAVSELHAALSSKLRLNGYALDTCWRAAVNVAVYAPEDIRKIFCKRDLKTAQGIRIYPFMPDALRDDEGAKQLRYELARGAAEKKLDELLALEEKRDRMFVPSRGDYVIYKRDHKFELVLVDDIDLKQETARVWNKACNSYCVNAPLSKPKPLENASAIIETALGDNRARDMLHKYGKTN